MKSMSIVLTARPSLIFKIISWFTKSDVSHAMLGYDDAFWGGRWTAASDWDGVRLYRAKQTCRHAVYEFRILFDPERGIANIRRLINQPYDYIDILAIGYVLVAWKWFKKKVRFPWRNPRAQICSEFVARFLKSSGLQGTEGWNPESITPDDIKAYCMSRPHMFESITPTLT